MPQPGRPLTAALGPPPAEPVDVVVDLGPAHPASHGGLRLRLRVDGDVVTAAEPVVGYLHRGAEKLFEARDYRQIIMLANRHDWLSAFASELGVVLAVERMLGLPVPERAVWLRTLLAELNRVFSHLVFLGTFPPALPPAPPAMTTRDEREAVQAVLEELSGGRMHFMFNRVGGVRHDMPAGWLDRVGRAADRVRAASGRLAEQLDRLRPRTTGVARLSAQTALQYGVSGPVARASGVDLDLRRDQPYLAYPELADRFRVVLGEAGDAAARFDCLLEQVGVSLELVEACRRRLAELPAGPVAARVPKVVRAPEGATYAWTENPIGINGYYLVSRGEPTPWRLKLRTASFATVQALAEVLPGCRLAELDAALASMFFVVGDVDR